MLSSPSLRLINGSRQWGSRCCRSKNKPHIEKRLVELHDNTIHLKGVVTVSSSIEINHPLFTQEAIQRNVMGLPLNMRQELQGEADA